MIQQCTLCGRTALDVESRIVADDTELGYHREARCVDGEACEERVQFGGKWRAAEVAFAQSEPEWAHSQQILAEEARRSASRGVEA